MKRINKWLVLTSIATLCLGGSDLMAQPGGGGGGGFGGGGMGGGGMGGMGGMGGARGGVLTQEQRQQIATALQDNAEMTALNTKLEAAQKAAIEAVMAKDASDATVKAKIKAVTDIQADIAYLRYTKGVKAVVPTLTDEQKSQINSGTPAMTYNTLFGGAGGMRGGMGGGMGGRGGRGAGGGAPN
jgi:Spy/CpxP family protein refolding chaperone